MAFVMILHLPADRKSLLTDILARWTRMRVLEGVDGALIQPNCVYVPPPHAVVTLANGRLGVRLPALDDPRVFRPIDAFFGALGDAVREQAVGIVLSGTGSDGALGLKAIKERGGLTIAQGVDGSAPQYGEMPAGAIATGAVDLVLPVEDMPAQLMRIKGATAVTLAAPDDPASVDAARLEICTILRGQLGHDFSGYRDKTFLRRVQRRMQVVNVTTLDEYIAQLKDDPREVVFLFRDLLIRVTSFFRDKDAFDALEQMVIPRLFAGKQADGTVRVWVPGCATGEEAYSLAILLREHMSKLRGAPKVQVFATDIDDFAISTARIGRYPSTLLDGLSPERIERFFSESQGSYVVSKDVRELCTFSPHNLVRDPPFSRMDLVSCRNLLIYMDTELQASVIPIFHYSLVPKGILLLGGSESTARHDDLFEPLNKAARIFQRRDTKSPPLNLVLAGAHLRSRRVDLVLGHSGGIMPALNGPLGSEAVSPSPPAQSMPTRNGSDDSDPHLSEQTAASRPPWGARMKRSLFPGSLSDGTLGRELASTKAELQSLSEEHQTALEELRSTNEELHSVNEEMQSANEELETSKEELQSVNEELHTVNVRLTEKVDELDSKNNDLRNLFESTEIATVFLDRHLVIRSFTPAIATLYNLIPSDQGRPLTDIVSRLQYDALRADVTHVLQTLEPLERQVSRKDRSAHYVTRILPYREADSTVSGVLVTFVDITNIVQAEAALREADIRKDVFLATLSHELRNPLAPIRTAAVVLNSPNLEAADLARAQAIISRQVGHMSSLLDDLLDVSRITSGSFELKKEYVDVGEILKAAVEAAQPAIERKRHTLRADQPATPLSMEVDPVRLTQVISNLLTNAAKYTPEGGVIELEVRLETDALTIIVRDNGIGLAPENLSQVFSMFARVLSDTARAEGGLGIGLALSKGLVELHGGRIEARSAGLGDGSEFAISLPRSVIVDPALEGLRPSNTESAHAPSRRVLIADDNRDGAESLEMFLRMAGHEVYGAHSGTEALQVASARRPDVAVLDIGMPDLSGYEVAKRIRREAWGAKIKLIAVTGWGQEEDKRAALLAGFDHHLTKPVDPSQLERLFDATTP